MTGGVLESLRALVVGYSDDSVLHPVLLSLGGHAVVVVAPLLLSVWRTGSVLAALIALALVVPSAWICGVEITHRRRPAWITATVVGSWVGGAAFAVFCEWTQVI
jgi:hypothetical protein